MADTTSASSFISPDIEGRAVHANTLFSPPMCLCIYLRVYLHPCMHDVVVVVVVVVFTMKIIAMSAQYSTLGILCGRISRSRADSPKIRYEGKKIQNQTEKNIADAIQNKH